MNTAARLAHGDLRNMTDESLRALLQLQTDTARAEDWFKGYVADQIAGDDVAFARMLQVQSLLQFRRCLLLTGGAIR